MTVHTAIVRTPQLLPGDVYSEAVPSGEVFSRHVKVQTVVLSEILYRGEYTPAYLVTGTDLRSKKPVVTFASIRRLFSAVREDGLLG